MTRVYVDIVGDLFHYGHVEFLKRARELGDELVVGVLSDECVEGYKRRPILTLDERVRVVEGCRHVDEVIAPGPEVFTEEWIRENRIDLVAHGDDWDRQKLSELYRVPIELGIFRVLPHTTGISTSLILERISDRRDCR